jgi:hypothetical protein
VLLARLPLLHPDGLTVCAGIGPADPLRRAVRRRAKLVSQRIRSMNRLTALLELLGPGYLTVFRARQVFCVSYRRRVRCRRPVSGNPYP